MGAFFAIEETCLQEASPTSDEMEQFDLKEFVESVHIVQASTTNYSYATFPSKYNHQENRDAINNAVDDIRDTAMRSPAELSDVQLKLLSVSRETFEYVTGYIEAKFNISNQKHNDYPHIFPKPRSTVMDLKQLVKNYADSSA
eukprot:89878_1